MGSTSFVVVVEVFFVVDLVVVVVFLEVVVGVVVVFVDEVLVDEVLVDLGRVRGVDPDVRDRDVVDVELALRLLDELVLESVVDRLDEVERLDAAALDELEGCDWVAATAVVDVAAVDRPEFFGLTTSLRALLNPRLSTVVVLSRASSGSSTQLSAGAATSSAGSQSASSTKRSLAIISARCARPEREFDEEEKTLWAPGAGR